MIEIIGLTIGVRMMNEYRYFEQARISERRKSIGQWMLDNRKQSIRQIAKEFGISKSQVHRDIHALRYIDDDVYIQCINILKSHGRIKHG